MSIKDVQLALQHEEFDPKGIDGIAGADTYAAVKAFQVARGLTADGVLRWETLHALFPDFPWSTGLAELAMQIACFQVGVREENGANSGLMVHVYQRAVGIPSGSSYCMAFDVWCYDQASDALGIPNPLVRTGSVLDQLRRTTCKVIPASEYTDPQPGDIGIIDLGDDHGHTFLVISSAGDGQVNTVEGNTNDDGSANGNGDYFRKRTISHIKAFIRV